MENLKQMCARYNLEIKDYTTAIIRKSVILLYSKRGYVRGNGLTIYMLIQCYNCETMLDQYSCISAHVLDNDRCGTNYNMVDDDTKCSMALSMQLQITPNMKISRNGNNLFCRV